MNSIILSNILYHLDPANTSCQFNDCHDEYQFLADSIQDVNVENLQNAFRDWFDVDLTEETAKQIVVEFEREI